jgi:hypothetical protein
MNDNTFKSLRALAAKMEANGLSSDADSILRLAALRSPLIKFPQAFRVWLMRKLVSLDQIDSRLTPQIMMQNTNRRLRDSPDKYLKYFNEWKEIDTPSLPPPESEPMSVPSPLRTNIDYGERQLNLFNRKGNNMIKELIKIANELDERGLVEESSTLDRVIEDVASSEGHPEDVSDRLPENANEEESRAFWKNFAIENFVLMSEWSEYEDLTDLWQSPDFEIVEYFDGVFERADMATGDSGISRELGYAIVDGITAEAIDRKGEDIEDPLKWMAAKFEEYMDMIEFQRIEVLPAFHKKELKDHDSQE